MLLYNAAGATSISDLQIQVRTSKLGFKITSTALSDKANLQAILVSLEKKGANGITPLISRVDLFTLLELSANNEGHFRYSANESMGTIDVSVGGALELGEDEYLTFSCTGIVAGQTIAIYALDHPLTSTKAVKYDNDNVGASTNEKDFNLVGVDVIAMPQDKVEKIYLEFGNGKFVKYTREELELIAQDMNELIAVGAITGSPYFNYIDYMVLGVQDAVRMVYVPVSGAAAHNIFRLKSVEA